MKKKTLCVSLAVIISATLLSGCAEKAPERFQKYGFYFDTEITLTVYDQSQEPLLDECFEMADHYEQLFSRTIETSDISHINQANGQPTTVDDETIELLTSGLNYCELSNGKFDITIGQLSSLWDFSHNDGFIPSAEEIQSAVDTIDYHNVIIDGNEVTLTDPNAMLDLGAIAKGFIADKMKTYLNEQGVTSGIISLGGNILTLDKKSDGTSYTVGIQKPFEENTALATVEVADQSVVSSGIYERYIEVDGTRYHHILDPATGYPYENNLYGVTIISDLSVDGDGLSTTCFALGLEDGLALIESLDGVEAVFITDDDELHLSSGIGTSIPFQEID